LHKNIGNSGYWLLILKISRVGVDNTVTPQPKASGTTLLLSSNLEKNISTSEAL
jgi:hypothetical protein